MKINFQTLKIYFHDVKIDFHVMKITFMSRRKEFGVTLRRCLEAGIENFTAKKMVFHAEVMVKNATFVWY